MTERGRRSLRDSAGRVGRGSRFAGRARPLTALGARSVPNGPAKRDPHPTFLSSRASDIGSASTRTTEKTPLVPKGKGKLLAAQRRQRTCSLRPIAGNAYLKRDSTTPHS